MIHNSDNYEPSLTRISLKKWWRSRQKMH